MTEGVEKSGLIAACKEQLCFTLVAEGTIVIADWVFKAVLASQVKRSDKARRHQFGGHLWHNVMVTRSHFFT